MIKRENLKVGMRYFFVYDYVINIDMFKDAIPFTIKRIEKEYLCSDGGVLGKNDWDKIWIFNEKSRTIEKVE